MKRKKLGTIFVVLSLIMAGIFIVLVTVNKIVFSKIMMYSLVAYTFFLVLFCLGLVLVSEE